MVKDYTVHELVKGSHVIAVVNDMYIGEIEFSLDKNGEGHIGVTSTGAFFHTVPYGYQDTVNELIELVNS